MAVSRCQEPDPDTQAAKRAALEALRAAALAIGDMHPQLRPPSPQPRQARPRKASSGEAPQLSTSERLSLLSSSAESNAAD